MNRPLQNRVLATGEIVATRARGTFMGNRGILHDDAHTLGRARWKHKAWIICQLKWKDWHRDIMRPGNYTELFFLDEAVALAAGHRPCALCRRQAFNAYRAAVGTKVSAPDLDARLHAERAVHRRHEQRRHAAIAESLPDGAVLWDHGPKLVWQDALFPIAPDGYGAAEGRFSGQVTVLTPPTTCAALKAGYRPILHPSRGAT